MGGHGALIHSMKRPDLFSGCIAFSAGIWTEEDMVDMPIENYKRWFADLYGERQEGDPMSDHFRENAVIYHAENAPVDSLKRVAWWIDCGDDDFLTMVNAKLHIAFEERGVSHEYRVRNGAHSWSYWRSGLVPGLSFLSDLFRQK
jgi:S-formylglutathione hydrolase FrmB